MNRIILFSGVCTLSLFLLSCATTEVSPKEVKREQVLSCTTRFIAQDVAAKQSYLICKDVYKRRK